MKNRRTMHLDGFNLDEWECYLYLRRELAEAVPVHTLQSLQKAFAPDPLEVIKTRSGGMIIGLRNQTTRGPVEHMLHNLSFWRTIDAVLYGH